MPAVTDVSNSRLDNSIFFSHSVGYGSEYYPRTALPPSNLKQPGPRSEDVSGIVTCFRRSEPTPGRLIKLPQSLVRIKNRGKRKIHFTPALEDSRQALLLIQGQHLKMIGRPLLRGDSIDAHV